MNQEMINVMAGLFRRFSQDSFVRYYSDFRDNQDSRDNSAIYAAFRKGGETWVVRSMRTRASNGKKIFENNQELDALRYIVRYSKKISEILRERAKEILLSNEIEEVQNSSTLSDDEKRVLVKVRIGQSFYRSNLIDYWCGCSVTSCTLLTSLVASHVKPYSECEEYEKFDVYNGLLLTPNYDKLFDKHLITFDLDGKIVLSHTMSIVNIEALGISRVASIAPGKLDERHKIFLRHHNKRFEELEKTR